MPAPARYKRRNCQKRVVPSHLPETRRPFRHRCREFRLVTGVKGERHDPDGDGSLGIGRYSYSAAVRVAPSRAALIGFLVRSVGIPHAIALILGGLSAEESHLITAPRIEPPVV